MRSRKAGSDSTFGGPSAYPRGREKVGLVKDVEPYELMKLRLINAGHQAIAYFGLLLDYELVHDTTRDELIVKFLEAYMDNEATSTLKPVAGIDLAAYKAKIVERFQNPNVRDTLARLAVDGSDRVSKFVMPVTQDRLSRNEDVWLSTAIIASFARYLDGVSESGKSIAIVDRMSDRLASFAKNLQQNVGSIANEEEVFGDLVNNQVFVETFKEIYVKIRQDGSVATLKWLLSKK